MKVKPSSAAFIAIAAAAQKAMRTIKEYERVCEILKNHFPQKGEMILPARSFEDAIGGIITHKGDHEIKALIGTDFTIPAEKFEKYMKELQAKIDKSVGINPLHLRISSKFREPYKYKVHKKSMSFKAFKKKVLNGN